jgi:hypothetical protein
MPARPSPIRASVAGSGTPVVTGLETAGVRS